MLYYIYSVCTVFGFQKDIFDVFLTVFGFQKDIFNIFLTVCFRKEDILKLWNELLELVAARRARLEKIMRLQKVFQEMINGVDWMDEIKVQSRLYLCTENEHKMLCTCYNVTHFACLMPEVDTSKSF